MSVERMISFFHQIPSGSEVYIHSISICIAFKLFNLGQTFRVAFKQASHNKLGEIWPIPPDRARVTESGFVGLIAPCSNFL
jgi:hypothetical protein